MMQCMDLIVTAQLLMQPCLTDPLRREKDPFAIALLTESYVITLSADANVIL